MPTGSGPELRLASPLSPREQKASKAAKWSTGVWGSLSTVRNRARPEGRVSSEPNPGVVWAGRLGARCLASPGHSPRRGGS